MSTLSGRAPARRRQPRRADVCQVNRLVSRWHDDRDRSSRDALFAQYEPMSRRLARRYYNAFEPQEDLDQVAAIGLLGAIDRFDPSRGVAFESFAIPTILGEIKRHFRNTGWSAHVPRGAQELAHRVERGVRELAAENRTTRVQDIADHLELAIEDVLIGMEAATAHYSISMDAPARSDEQEDSMSMGEALGCDDDGYGLVDAKLSLASAMPYLPHLERTALRYRIEDDLKQADIAARMGCSQMQVSRLLRRAAARLREITDGSPFGQD